MNAGQTNVSRFGYIQSERPMLEAELSCDNGGSGAGMVYIYGMSDGVYIQTDTHGMTVSESFGYSVSDGGTDIMELPVVMTNALGDSSSAVFTDGADVMGLADKTLSVHGKNNDIISGVLKRVL